MEAKTRVTRDEDMACLPEGGTQVNPLTRVLVVPATARERRRSIMAWEKANIIEHRLDYDKADYLRQMCSLKDRRQPKPEEISEPDVSDDGNTGPSHPTAGPSQDYTVEHINNLIFKIGKFQSFKKVFNSEFSIQSNLLSRFVIW